jgi:sialate O-acetylesterase
MVGDVWVVSGQSNMYWRLKDTDPGERANGVNSATLPGVRFFQIQLNDDPSRTRTDLAYDFGQSWSVCSPQTAAGYSAVAFYAAQRLHSALSNVPIGIIDASWSGTAIQSWMTPESIDANQDIRRADAASSLPLISTWDRTPEAAREAATAGLFFNAEFRNVTIDGVPVPLNTTTWVKGGPAAVGVNSGVAFIYGYTRALGYVYAGLSFSGKIQTGKMRFEIRGTGRFDVATQLDPTTDPDHHRSSPFSATNTWTPIEVDLATMAQDPNFGSSTPMVVGSISNLLIRSRIGTGAPAAPGGCFNGMLRPVSRLPIKGYMWYQGEANAVGPIDAATGKSAARYDLMLGSLISGWRTAWSDASLPFAIVQLPNFDRTDSPNATDEFRPFVRESQAAVAANVQNTAMCVTIDTAPVDGTGFSDVHPLFKRPVGIRLANAILAKFYGQQLRDAGPGYSGSTVSGSQVTVRFGGTRIALRGEPNRAFTIAGADGVYAWADARLGADGTSILLSSTQVSTPTKVRHAWGNNPRGFVSHDGPVADALPVAPFRDENLGSGGPVNQPPTVAVPAGAASATVVGTTVALSVQGADDQGEAGLIYTWTSAPEGAVVSVNRSNAARETTATFSKPGVYQFTVAIADAQGASVSSQVSVTVQSTPTRITATTSVGTVVTGGTVAVSGAVTDQFGLPTSPGTLTWSAERGTVAASGNGSSGVYTAPATVGTDMIQVRSGSLSGSASLAITASAPPAPVDSTSSSGGCGLGSGLASVLLAVLGCSIHRSARRRNG